MTQTTLNFKLESTNEKLTPRTGVAILGEYLKGINLEELILDIEATFIEAHKNTAKWSYKDAPGYLPMVGHINGGYVIDVDFREGNAAPGYLYLF